MPLPDVTPFSRRRPRSSIAASPPVPRGKTMARTAGHGGESAERDSRDRLSAAKRRRMEDEKPNARGISRRRSARSDRASARLERERAADEALLQSLEQRAVERRSGSRSGTLQASPDAESGRLTGLEIAELAMEHGAGMQLALIQTDASGAAGSLAGEPPFGHGTRSVVRARDSARRGGGGGGGDGDGDGEMSSGLGCSSSSSRPGAGGGIAVRSVGRD